ncbi:DUF2520 domain-containing protein, partial [Pseudobutyrivibrio sp.]|uniref:DUF2520 domain-containing protein n=1 Tax=Pseudobutyrivibrio sp. TaxID=2014367 RepID=UPI001B55942F
EEQLADAIAPLITGNISKVLSVGTKAALTGPIERNDISTVMKHLDTFKGIDKDIYKVLSKKTCDIAKLKHPETDYKALEQLLNS